MSSSWLYFTCDKLAEAQKLAKILVEKRLVACANVMSPCESYYEWQGKFTKSTEIPVLCKTRSNLVKDAIKLLEKEHSFDVPSITSVKIQRGSKDFLSWIKTQTKAAKKTQKSKPSK